MAAAEEEAATLRGRAHAADARGAAAWELGDRDERRRAHAVCVGALGHAEADRAGEGCCRGVGVGGGGEAACGGGG